MKQCKTCPWRKNADPFEIPNGYSLKLHLKLRETLASPDIVEQFTGPMKMMGCHYSKPGEEFPCAGWMHHQLGDGNNIRLRLAMRDGLYEMPEIDGEQHKTFEETLPHDR